MATAATAGAAATGARAWLATRSWISPLLLKRLTVGLVAAALIASAFVISGSGQPQAARADSAPAAPAP